MLCFVKGIMKLYSFLLVISLMGNLALLRADEIPNDQALEQAYNEFVQNPEPIIKELESQAQQSAMVIDMIKDTMWGRLNKTFNTTATAVACDILLRQYLPAYSKYGIITLSLASVLDIRELAAFYSDYQQLKMMQEKQDLYQQQVQEIRMLARSAKKQK